MTRAPGAATHGAVSMWRWEIIEDAARDLEDI